jgi:hypothetical protein
MRECLCFAFVNSNYPSTCIDVPRFSDIRSFPFREKNTSHCSCFSDCCGGLALEGLIHGLFGKIEHAKNGATIQEGVVPFDGCRNMVDVSSAKGTDFT